MKYDKRIETDRLIVRPWNLSTTDKEAFHELNSDDKIMHFFPFRRSRELADQVLENMINTAKNDGYGWAAICLKGVEQPIGFAGLSKVSFEADFVPATEIGWRLRVPHWHKGYATEAAKALVEHGFEELQLEEIVSFAIAQNKASIAIMQKLGMRRDRSLDFDLPGIDDTYAHLRRHEFYSLSRQDWQ